ncbi:hypothetical protein NC651_009273 [Populus alba x Populus x berolinensis]|nr:hypothetical protein NC651_009273 [Populus alba x Populus x berolinensis]
MAARDNTQIELECKMLFSELDHFIAKSQEKSDRSSKEIIAAKFFKIEVEALVIARNNLDQEVRAKIDKARQWLNQKMDEFKTKEGSHEDIGLIAASPISSNSKLNFFQCLPSDTEAMAADHRKSSLQGGTEQLMSSALGISEDTLPGSWNPLPEEIEPVKAAVCECLDKARLIRSSMAGEDNAQIDPEIQNLVKKLDECIAKFDQKRQVLQNAIESETAALKKDQNETRELSNSYSVLIVDDDRNARDTIQRYTMPVGTEKHRAMEFQEAKNGKEAVYLHLAGASFDLIIMDNQMPVMTGIQATQLPRKMGVKSPIIEIIAAKSFKIEIEAWVLTRNNLDQEVRAKIDKARQWLNQKVDEFKTKEGSHEDTGLIAASPISSNSKLNVFPCLPSDPEAMAADHRKSSLQGGTEQLMSSALGISEDTLPGSWNPLPEEIERVKASVREGLDKARERSFVYKEALSDLDKFLSKSLPSKTTDMADEDYTQIDPEIQNLVKKLDVCIAKFDQKRQVLENAIESEIEALKKDQNETRKLRLNLLHESGATSSNIEAGSRKVANVKQWLNQKALISGDTSGDHDQGNVYSVLIVHDDRDARDTIWRYVMVVGTEQQFTLEFQEAKNGKEAVYLHLAGASFDLIIMDDQMPIMTGIQATQLLRKMGVKSQIIGFASESVQQAFIDAGADECLKMPPDSE